MLEKCVSSHLQNFYLRKIPVVNKVINIKNNQYWWQEHVGNKIIMRKIIYLFIYLMNCLEKI